MTGPADRPATSAPGVVKIRLSGTADDIAAVARLLGQVARAAGCLEFLEVSRPYPNRREAGERVYLTVRTTTLSPRGGPAQPPSTSGPALPLPDCTARTSDEWACLRCGLAFFGTPPEHGLCPTCYGEGDTSC